MKSLLFTLQTPNLITLRRAMLTGVYGVALTSIVACDESATEVTTQEALLEASALEIQSADVPELLAEPEEEGAGFCSVDNLERRGRDHAEGRRGPHGERGHGERGERGHGEGDERHAERHGEGHHGEGHHGEGHGPRGERGEHMEVVLNAYDVDGDGALSDEEQATLEADLVAGCEARRAALIEAFDTDGDGALSEEERASAQEAIAAEREAERVAREAALLESYDADGDGELSHEERHVARDAERAAREAALVEAYDVDGDGELSDEEQATMEEARAAEVRAAIQSGEAPVPPRHD